MIRSGRVGESDIIELDITIKCVVRYTDAIVSTQNWLQMDVLIEYNINNEYIEYLENASTRSPTSDRVAKNDRQLAE